MTSLTIGDLQSLPAVVDLRTACKAFSIGKTVGYSLAQAGQFPCPVLKVRGQYRVPTAGIWEALGVQPTVAMAGATE